MKNACFWILLSLTSCFTFNSNGKADKNVYTADEILDLIEKGKPVILKEKKITGNLDFTKTSSTHPISAEAHLVQIQSPLYFENCIFEGDIISYFQNGPSTRISRFNSDLIFFDCRIMGNVDLSQSRFNGIFSLTQSDIEGNFTASNTIFQDISDFKASRFEKDLSLTYSTFQQRSNCMDLTVLGKTYLQGTRYNKESLWSNSVFEQYVDVSKITSQSSFMMDYCDFKGQLHISGSEFWGYVNIAQAKFSDSFTIRTSLFSQRPILDDNGWAVVQLEKNRLLIDENLSHPSINK